MRCDRCDREIPEGSVVCPFCTAHQGDAPTSLGGADGTEGSGSFDDAVTSADMPTRAASNAPTSGSSLPSLSSSDAGQHGRFLPGTLVAERYRIVGLLGRGGMGEVYRADDLKLGQPVALKFLPDSATADAEQVQRLFDEVRMARRVSHPNVCRVFDVAETEGLHYVSMEYVDGEDLSSLLRRIGRLPEDKAVEIARQLCAALAAAHEEGVLHRDLKPANVMLDGRGRVKLTDFGLAAVTEVRAGTPIYMAPEQLAGTEVSVRSDLYSLGLVLHELFTGKRVFEADDFNELSRLHAEPLATSLTDISQLDPAVDRLVRRCLERDPDNRPASALAVAAALPGADPLAAALAAGETPSPEMVAEAGGEGRLSLALALPTLLFVLVGALAVGLLQAQRSVSGWVQLEQPPAVLDARAAEVLAALGYDSEFADTASGFASDNTYFGWLRSNNTSAGRRDLVPAGRTAAITYWWRGSPQVLIPGPAPGVSIGGAVGRDDPPRTLAGMVGLELDPRGRLRWFDAVPGRVQEADGAPADPVNWTRLFELMGLEISAFRETPPQLTPEHFADERRAWEGAFPEAPDVTLRVEAAALNGRPVAVRTFTPANPLAPAPGVVTLSDVAEGGGLRLSTIVAVVIIVGIVGALLVAIFGGIYVAQRNVRSGRGDAGTARRLGFLIAFGMGIGWLAGEHTYSAQDINLFIEMLVFVGAMGGLTWALYLAVEPFMRRHSPEALIGWTRLMDGRFRDPLVGRDILIGCAAGVLSRLFAVVPLVLDDRVATAGLYVGMPPRSIAVLLEIITSGVTIYVLLGLGLSFLYGLTYLLVGRRHWIAYAGWVAFMSAPALVDGLVINNSRPSATVWSGVFWLFTWLLLFYVVFRLGLLVFVVMSSTGALLATAVPTLDFAAWYGTAIVGAFVVLAALAIYAFSRCARWRGGLADALGGD